MKSPLSSTTGTTTNTTADGPTETVGENALAPLLTAWDLAHPDLTDPEWRHLLDEIAHPRTTQAFHLLATGTAAA